MKIEDGDRFAVLMEWLNTAFPRQAISVEAQQMVYWPVLRDLTIDQVQRAVELALKHETDFMPAPGKLREYVLGVAEDRAALAWARIKRASLAGYGYYRDLDFGDPALHAAVVAMGGWRVLYHLGFGESEQVDWVTARKEFMQLYAHYERRGAPDDTPAALRGLESESRGTVQVPASPAAIERPSLRALPPAEPTGPRGVRVYAKEEFGAMLDELTGKVRVVEVRRSRDERPRLVPVSVADLEQHAKRKAEAVSRFQEAAGGQGDDRPA